MLYDVATYVVVFGVGLYSLIQFAIGFLLPFAKTKFRSNDQRRISVLVAARNEEALILNCLKSLENQNYPRDKFEVLVGDDGSEDGTAALIKEFTKDKPYFKYHYIDFTYPGLRGKQNVLANLARKAEGELFLITDADIEHHPEWAAQLSAGFDKEGVGVVAAPTVVRPGGLWETFQMLDWLNGVAAIKSFDFAGLPVTSIGNNMAVTRSAYEKIGGYEALPFSITEDFLLFKTILQAGYECNWLFNRTTLNLSAATYGWKNLLNQRRRWFKGGLDGSALSIILFSIYAFATPMLLLSGLFLETSIWVILLALKFGADLFTTIIAGLMLGQLKEALVVYPLYAAFFTINMTLLPVYTALKNPVVWKGRKF